MGVTKFQDEHTSTIAPKRMFKALVVDSHNLLPQLVPYIKSIDILEGDGGAGTVKQTNFPEGSHFKHLKHKTEELDEANYYCKYTLFEGGPVGDNLESITYEVKFEAAPGGGSVSKVTSHYHAKGDFVIKEEEIKAGKGKASEMYKVVEEHLHAHPDLYA